MRHRRTARVLGTALLASALAVGLAPGASAHLPDSGTTTTPPTSATTVTISDGATTPTMQDATTEPSALTGPSILTMTTASGDSLGGVSGGTSIPDIKVQETPPTDVDEINPEPVTALLGALVDALVNPEIGQQVCPAADLDTATCDQAYAVVDAISPCIAPFLAGTRAGCNDLVPAATGLLNRIAAEGVACANGNNAVCETATDTALGATHAMLACLGVDVSLTNATRMTVVAGRQTNVDLYALCAQVVAAGIEVAGQAVAAATACAEGGDATCANIVATVVDASNATLRCLGSDVTVNDTILGGHSLISADLAGACEQAVTTAKDGLGLLIAQVNDCKDNPAGTCQQAIESAGSAAAQIVAEATDATTQAARCLTGEGDATGEMVAACQEVQDRIASVLADTNVYTGEGLVEVGVGGGELDIAIGTTFSAHMAFALDPTTLPEVENATKTTTVTDAAGAILSQTREDVETTAAQVPGGKCVLSGNELKKRSIQAYPPVTSNPGDKGIDIQYTFHAYQSNMARPLIGVGWTWQVEICSVGGAQTFNGFRLRRVGSGHTIAETKQSRIDASWRSGRDLPTVEANLYAHVGSENDPVQVGGSISQKAAGVNGGSSGARMPESMPEYDNFRHNGALGRWDTVCMWYANPMVCGSRDFQGTVVHTLHEWPRSDAATKEAVLAVFAKRACTTRSQKCAT